MPFTIPSSSHNAGDPGFIGDINNEYAATAAITGINVLNTAYAGGADPTGASDSTAAIQAAINAVPAAGGVVYLPAGTYKVSSTLTVSTAATFLQGAGRRATFIQYWGSGDCIYMHSLSASSLNQGGGVLGITIDGTHSSAATSGLSIGDWYQLQLDVEAYQFSTVGSFGVHFLNALAFTEKTRGFIAASFNDTCVGFDVSTSVSTANRSFGYTDLAFEFDGMTGNGIKVMNGAQVYHSRISARANVHPGVGSSYACILLNGKTAAGVQNPGSASQIGASYLDFQAEASSTTNVQSTILFDLGNNTRVFNCQGILDFGFGSQMALCNTSQSAQGSNNFQFVGVVSGDTNLNPGGAFCGFTSAAPRLYGLGQFTAAGGAATSLGDFFTLTLSASVTISLTGGTLATAVAGPQRKTFLITQAAAGGPYTVTWPKPGSPTVTSPAVYWAGGTAPTMSAGAGAVDKYVLETADGIHWYGTAAQALA